MTAEEYEAKVQKWEEALKAAEKVLRKLRALEKLDPTDSGLRQLKLNDWNTNTPLLDEETLREVFIRGREIVIQESQKFLEAAFAAGLPVEQPSEREAA
jgi:hypothetical protein